MIRYDTYRYNCMPIWYFPIRYSFLKSVTKQKHQGIQISITYYIQFVSRMYRSLYKYVSGVIVVILFLTRKNKIKMISKENLTVIRLEYFHYLVSKWLSNEESNSCGWNHANMFLVHLQFLNSLLPNLHSAFSNTSQAQ